MADLRIQNEGSILILFGESEIGRAWIVEHIPEDAIRWAGGVIVEPRYIDAIIQGAIGDGLEV
jgi:hypothetical protein